MSVYKNDRPDYFRQALASVLDQTAPPDEIVLVVDGPISGALDEAVRKSESEVPVLKVVRLAENVGHAGARQAALEAASNELIAIMDSDDIAVRDRFRQQLDLLGQNPGISVVGGLIQEFIGTPGNNAGIRYVPEHNGEIIRFLKARCPMNLMTVMYRRSDVLKAGGFIDWYCEEDYYLWIRLSLAGYRMHNIQQILVNARVGRDMYRRRGGWSYFRSEARLQGYMLRHGVISLPRYLYNVAGRFAMQVAMPNSLRGAVYRLVFRKEK